MCGEKRVLMAFSELIKGSPPRVRGKDDSIGRSKFNARITPACAGKRHHRGHPSWQAQDHPRVCGEKYCGISLHLTIQGSPPRVRGKAPINGQRYARFRITPACAGKRLKKAHKIKDFDPVPIRFHLVFRRFERWCSNLPTPDGNVPV